MRGAKSKNLPAQSHDRLQLPGSWKMHMERAQLCLQSSTPGPSHSIISPGWKRHKVPGFPRAQTHHCTAQRHMTPPMHINAFQVRGDCVIRILQGQGSWLSIKNQAPKLRGGVSRPLPVSQKLCPQQRRFLGCPSAPITLPTGRIRCLVSKLGSLGVSPGARQLLLRHHKISSRHFNHTVCIIH